VSEAGAWGLFERFGVELEYMIVGRGMAVLAATDELLRRQAGRCVSDVVRGPITWSNELVAHVIELKNTEPVPRLEPLVELFAAEVPHINGLLQPLDARLLPTAMHPWMDPARETRLWPHGGGEVYQAYDRIFDCRGHGWSNLQSVHLNLPFASDDEFGRLHAAVRLVLPILPALAASSPLADGRPSGLLDTRLDYYRTNSIKIPSVAGRVIPEAVFTRERYEQEILQPMYAEIAPHDPQGILRDEFLNSRGAIARFSRSTIEIRLLDVQECPLADLAVCAAVAAVLEGMVGERWAPLAVQSAWPVEPLERILLKCTRDAERAVIDDPAYLACLGLKSERCLAGQIWRHLLDDLSPVSTKSLDPGRWRPAWQILVQEGPLARRILESLEGVDWADRAASHRRLMEVYAELAGCLAENRMFTLVGRGD
jgi:hypothetical protein